VILFGDLPILKSYDNIIVCSSIISIYEGIDLKIVSKPEESSSSFKSSSERKPYM